MTKHRGAKQEGTGPAPSARLVKTGKKARKETGNNEAVEALVKANEVMLEGMAAMQREILEFGNSRLRQDLETQGALSQCKDFDDLFRLQVEFAQKAMQQYSEEAAKLLDLSTKVGQDCWVPLESATRTTVDELTPH